MKRRRIFYSVLPVLILFLLVPGSIAVYYLLANPTTAQVSILPSTKRVQHLSTLTIVTNHPDVAHQQIVGARWLSATIKQTVLQTSTGKGYSQGTTASGIVALEDHAPAFSSVSENAGTILTGSDGITIISDQDAIAFLGRPAYFRAHVSSPGSYGNIPAHGFYLVVPHGLGNSAVLYNTTPFTGGHDKGPYAFVQQNDIVAGEHTLSSIVKQSTLDALNAKMAVSEQWVQTPRCTRRATSDGTTGEQVQHFHVTITTTCAGEVYDTQMVQAVAARELISAASSELGTHYQLLGEIATTITEVHVLNKRLGTLTVSLSAEGKWVYRFTDVEKQRLAQMISGKHVEEAQTLLVQQPTIEQVTITTMYSFWIWDTIPADVKKISIVILQGR
jgi:VCBS repeat-containing protein